MLNILYQDDYLAAVDKPPGLLGLQRLWLHALRLEFVHPHSGAALAIAAASGPEWALWKAYRVEEAAAFS